ALDLVLTEVGRDIEADAVDASRQRLALRYEVGDAAIGIGAAHRDVIPLLRAGRMLQRDANAPGGHAAGGVEDVGGEGAHERSFLSRRCVILFCSSAAISIS